MLRIYGGTAWLGDERSFPVTPSGDDQQHTGQDLLAGPHLACPPFQPPASCLLPSPQPGQSVEVEQVFNPPMITIKISLTTYIIWEMCPSVHPWDKNMRRQAINYYCFPHRWDWHNVMEEEWSWPKSTRQARDSFDYFNSYTIMISYRTSSLFSSKFTKFTYLTLETLLESIVIPRA